MTTQKLLLGIIGLIIIVLSLTWYWFSYRPEQIRRACYQKATQAMIERDWRKTFEKEYRNCLLERGVKE